jgi:calcineurin-like phosphoesterase family protein
MNTWFTSDHHFGHHNILTYSNRPFESVAAMEEAFVYRHNCLVARGDQVYFLGDFSFEDPSRIVPRLNGQKFLIIGNHDWRWKKQHHACPWAWIRDVELVKVGDQAIWLSHYPHRSWPGSAHGTWHLHGHEHGNRYSTATDTRPVADVGVDCWNYFPVPFETLRDRFGRPS